MLNEKMKYDAPEDELTARIDSFMTRQRREVLEKIYERGRISHKELAAAIGSTPTSLWNICQNFRSFQPELIKSEAQGRFQGARRSEAGRRRGSEVYASGLRGGPKGSDGVFHPLGHGA